MPRTCPRLLLACSVYVSYIIVLEKRICSNDGCRFADDMVPNAKAGKEDIKTRLGYLCGDLTSDLR